MKIIEKILDENLNIDNNTFVFDIETTGLNPKFCKVILIGILYNCQNKTIVKQFFAENENEEENILIAFTKEIRNFKKHITYNGIAFDIKFLNYRLEKHNINFKLNNEDDFDIFKFIKQFKYALNLKSCSLTSVEATFGINRDDIIDGSKSIELYKEFVENQDENLLETILLHNYEDIYNLSKLVNIQDLVKEKLNLLEINVYNQLLEVYPLKYKINSQKLTMEYFIFNSQHHNISIYNDKYSILHQDNSIYLEININKGIDRNNNTILFYNLSEIIPLKFNDDILEKNIYTLCNFILKNEISNL